MTNETLSKEFTEGFSEGFEMAIKLVDNVLHGLNFTEKYSPSNIIEMVEEEIEAYKNDK